jgi:hypothetical protein
MIATNYTADGRNIKPGDRITFAEDPEPYTVRAADARYAICTRKHDYTIVDWDNGIRGLENLLYGLGTETDLQCQDMLRRLTAKYPTEVSQRNRLALQIVSVNGRAPKKKSGEGSA